MSIKISLKFITKGLINDIPGLVQIVAWRQPGDNPLSEPMNIRIIRPQWVQITPTSTSGFPSKVITIRPVMRMDSYTERSYVCMSIRIYQDFFSVQERQSMWVMTERHVCIVHLYEETNSSRLRHITVASLLSENMIREMRILHTWQCIYVSNLLPRNIYSDYFPEVSILSLQKVIWRKRYSFEKWISIFW